MREMKKTIITLVTIQCFILLSFLCLLYQAKPIDITTATQRSIVIERIRYRRGYNESNLYVYANSSAYLFCKGGLASDYHGIFEISEALHEGDMLTITYIEEQSFFGKTNLVIDAFSEEEEYLSYEKFNTEQRVVQIVLTIFFSVFELAFIVITIFVIMLNTGKTARNKKHYCR